MSAKEMFEDLKINEWLELIKEDKNLKGAYICISQYIYLIQKENQELKKQLEEINKFKFSYRKDETKIPPVTRKQKDVEIIKNLEKENQTLKKQLEERPKEYVFIGNTQNKTRDFINQITKDNKEFENQQKEFIDYLKKTIEELECEDVDDEEMKGYLIQRTYTFKEILSKYKEIIGVSDEKK